MAPTQPWRSSCAKAVWRKSCLPGRHVCSALLKWFWTLIYALLWVQVELLFWLLVEGRWGLQGPFCCAYVGVGGNSCRLGSSLTRDLLQVPIVVCTSDVVFSGSEGLQPVSSIVDCGWLFDPCWLCYPWHRREEPRAGNANESLGTHAVQGDPKKSLSWFLVPD